MKSLLITFLFIASAFADELDYAKHHNAGSALINNSTVAAYRYEDFDVGHVSQVGMQTLIRIYLVPISGLISSSGSCAGDNETEPCNLLSNSWQTVSLHTDSRGHYIWSLGTFWNLDLTPIDHDIRLSNISTAYQPVIAQRHVIIKQLADTILIVITDK